MENFYRSKLHKMENFGWSKLHKMEIFMQEGMKKDAVDGVLFYGWRCMF